MRVFKPLQLSLQTKPLQWNKKNHLVVTVLLGFPFDSAKDVLLEQDLWAFLPDELGNDGMLDANMPKPQGETVVFGNYYAPEGKPVTADRVKLKMGSINKELVVVGHRYWGGLAGPSAPEPFKQLSLSYEYAFGGKDNPKNPSGKGMDKIDVFGEMRLPLPNIENPKQLITAKSQRPNPAGFRPLDMTWQQRASKAGTYDKKWLEAYFPGLAPDMDWNYFNTVAQDQWIDGFWNGDESFQLLNMHPDKVQLNGKLPGFRTRCFVEKKNAHGSLFTEIEMQAETTFLFPHIETGVILYRGSIEVKEDDATDVAQLLLAYEDLAQLPRAEEYYQEALYNRLDESKTFKYMMYTKDIIPDSERCGFARMLDEAGKDGDSELSKNLEVRVAAEKEKALASIEQQKQKLAEQLSASGIDPAPHLAKFDGKQDQAPDDPHVKKILETMEKLLPGSSTGNSADVKLEDADFSQFDVLTKQMDEMAAAKKEEAKEQLKKLIIQVEGTKAEDKVRQQVEQALVNIDAKPLLPRPANNEALDHLLAQIEKVEEIRQKMRAQGLPEQDWPVIDVDILQVTQNMEEANIKLKKMYQMGAHNVVGRPPHELPMDIVQARFEKKLQQGESLVGEDFSGVDMSGLDLSGQDLSECYLECVNFTNTQLVSANLTGAIITHANLSNADLTKANLQQANLGSSILIGARLHAVNLKNAVLSKSDLTDAQLTHSNLEEVDFLEAKMAGIDMSGSTTTAANFLEMNLSGAKFVGSIMRECNFLQSQLEGVDFSQADISGSNFVECQLNNSKFVNANMHNVRFPSDCSLRDCDFRHAKLDKANFREVDAENSLFEESTFHQADFSGANLQHTKFYGAQGKGSLFMKTNLGYADFSSVNLMEGSLMHARLTGANMSYSNFYGVEFMNATVGGTDFTGANLDQTKLENWRPQK